MRLIPRRWSSETWICSLRGHRVPVASASRVRPHELVARFTVVRVGAFIVNVALLVFLVWTKRLFAIRGGHAALERPFDWRSALAAPEVPTLDPVDLVAAVREAGAGAGETSGT